MTVGVSGPWTPFATLSASMARTRRQNCQISLYAHRDPPAQKGDISALHKRGHFYFALTQGVEGAAFKTAGERVPEGPLETDEARIAGPLRSEVVERDARWTSYQQ